MTNHERVSCVIPVFNGERYLGETIENALQQTHPLHEIIVMDDGSTDGSAAVVAGFGDRVRYAYQPNSGHAAARNRGAKLASGDFIAFQDADDLWLPEKTAMQLAAFASDPGLFICVTFIENFPSPDVPAERQLPVYGPRAKPMPGYASSCLMVRPTVFDVVGSFDTSFKHADIQQWFREARRLGVREQLLPEVLARRRMHETNRSRVFAEESRLEFLRTLKAGLDVRRAEKLSAAQNTSQ